MTIFYIKLNRVMKYIWVFLLSGIIITGCKKENYKASNVVATDKSFAALSDTLDIPINDLATGTFMGNVGGLYPGGANVPSGKYAKDLQNFALSITKLDTSGLPSADGKILFISVGGSTGGHNMTELKKLSQNNPLVNPYLTLLNCNNGYGSASLNSLMNANDAYWYHVRQIINGSGSGFKQVQVVYLETEDSTSLQSFPERGQLVKQEIEASARVIKVKFPNAKLLYLLARPRTFGDLAIPNREPNPYYFGWGCKWAVEDQINGVSGTAYKGSRPKAPLITWGWYQWADGSSTPRQDGFTWQVTDTKDGLHASKAGQDTLATRFQNFLLTDKYASIWYAAH